MNIADMVTIGGRSAEVVEVRNNAPVAVVVFDDGERELHWYGNTDTTTSGPVRGPRVKPGGFANEWINAHVLAPINNRPSSEELAALWGLNNPKTSQGERYSREGTEAESHSHADAGIASIVPGDREFSCRQCSKAWTGLKPEHCIVCHQTFGGTDAGDRHRVGSYSDPGDPRRCLDPAQVGLILNDRGLWSRPFKADRKAA